MNRGFENLDALVRAVRSGENPSEADRRAVRRGLGALLSTTLATSTVAASTVAKASFFSTFVWPFAVGAFAGTAVVVTTGVVARPELFDKGVPKGEPSANRSVVALPKESRTPDYRPSPVAAPPSRTSGPALERKSAPLERAPTTNEPSPVSPSEPGARQSLQVESRALAEAQRALRDHDAERALRLLDEQDRVFAGGALVEERAAARVFASCGSGDRAGGREAAERFQQRFPGSLHAERVRVACEKEGLK